MHKDQFTALLAALLIGSRRHDLSPSQAVELAEEIQQTIEANERATRLAAQVQSKRANEEANSALARLLGKLKPDQP